MYNIETYYYVAILAIGISLTKGMFIVTESEVLKRILKIKGYIRNG